MDNGVAAEVVDDLLDVGLAGVAGRREAGEDALTGQSLGKVRVDVGLVHGVLGISKHQEAELAVHASAMVQVSPKCACCAKDDSDC